MSKREHIFRFSWVNTEIGQLCYPVCCFFSSFVFVFFCIRSLVILCVKTIIFIKTVKATKRDEIYTFQSTAI